MGLNYINGKNVYLDANIFIYAIEGNKKYEDKVKAIFSKIKETKSIIVTSELTLIECLVKPYGLNDNKTVSIYEKFIKPSDFLVVKPLPLDLLKEAAKLRGLYKNKLPDSIHLATALQEKCNVFISNDGKIKAPDNIKLLTIEEL